MEKHEIDCYKKAGTVWASAIKLARKNAKAEANLFELAEEVEKYILSEGAQIAFPINLSVNEQAAHYTPKYNDAQVLLETDLMKIDIGVAVDGYICDGAITINLDNTHAKQIEANKLALDNAISVATFGKPVERIGAEIEKTLKSKGFNPIYNLGGHGLGKNNIHSKPSIPNHAGGSSDDLEEGAIAIEPFASSGKGQVAEDALVEIFSLKEKKGARNPTARQLLTVAEKYEGRPFAERWLRKELEGKATEFNITMGLRELLKSRALHAYHGLKEGKGTWVTQVEKTVLIIEGKTIVLGE
jgi:methionyl aminopeptidase